MSRAAVAAALLLSAFPVAASGQDRRPSGPARAADSLIATTDRLSEEALLTLRPSVGLDGLSRRVAPTLALRAQVRVTVGEAPLSTDASLLPTGHIALFRDGPEVSIVFSGPAGLVYTTRMDLPSSHLAAARAVALAIEGLRDAALDGPEVSTVRVEGSTRYVYFEQVGGLFGVRRTHRFARPTIALRSMLGFSTARSTAFFAPGIGLGLCSPVFCTLLEGDLPAWAEVHRPPRGAEIIRYRPVNLGLRMQVRPHPIQNLVPAVTAGILTRFGNAWIGNDAKLVTSFGFRASAEVAWIFDSPFELVLELGGDIALNPARFEAAGEVLFIEDAVTLWATLALRVRP